MPVFRLTPIRGTERSPQWRASTIKPFCIWVRADDEYEARRWVARATAVAKPGEATLAPWKDPELVACECDQDKNIADGIIWIRKKPIRLVHQQQRPRLTA